MSYDDDSLTPEDWKELLEYQKKTMAIISENTKKSFDSKKINSFSYKSCSVTTKKPNEMPNKMEAKSFSA